MPERRRTTRFVVPDCTEATFRVMQDVCVEKSSGDQVVLVSDAPLRPSESMMLELPRAQGVRLVAPVDLVNCNPVWIGDACRYRTVLKTDGPADVRPRKGAVTKFVKAPPVTLPAIGVLIRRVAVRVRDVSSSGCLLESHDSLPEGTVGQLEFTVGDEPQSEPLRVCRSSFANGSPWPWRAGAHFLALNAPAPASVRNVVARFEIIDELMAGNPLR